MFKGKAASVLSQAIYIIMLARTLEVAEFGLFTGIIALISFFIPFLGFGSEFLLVRNISRHKDSYNATIADCVLFYFISALLLCSGLFFINSFVLAVPFPYLLFGYLVGAELLYKFANLPARIFQGFEEMKGASVAWFVISFSKLITVALFVVVENESLELWAFWYFYNALLVAALLSIATFVKYGGFSFARLFNFNNVSLKFNESISFSISDSLEKTYTNIDKFLLLKIASPSVAGMYSAAYQFIKLAEMPLRVLLTATYPVFFQSGAKGLKSALHFSKTILPYSLLQGFLASVILFMAAPLSIILLGAEYQQAVEVIRWLAILPLLQAVYRIPADALSGSGNQPLRIYIQIGAVLINVLLNVLLIPSYSWYGAVTAILISEFFLLCALGSLFMYHNFNMRTDK